MRADHAVESGPRRIDLDALVKATERQLGQFLVQVMRNRTLAEDVLQETLLVAIERRSKLESLENPRAWLFGVARNRALHALRRGRRARAAGERLAHPRDDARGPAGGVAGPGFVLPALFPVD